MQDSEFPNFHETNNEFVYESAIWTDAPVLADAALYMREHWDKFVVASGLVLVPCIWHRRIVTADIGSHLYNAWLVQLIHRGQAPGLWIARQWSNVLFDFILSGLSSAFGFLEAEKIGVSICILIFFWGIFALIAAATRRAPWTLTPCIALVTYGYTFHMGFFNYYLSLGLSFFALAVFWRGKDWELLAGIALIPLIALANPLGLMWLIGAAAYVKIAEKLRGWHQWLMLPGAGVVLFGMRYYLWHHYEVEAAKGPFYFFNGADQLVLFGVRYHIVMYAFLAFALLSLVVDAISRRYELGSWKYYSIPLQLYIVTELAVPLLPRGVTYSQHAVGIALLTERLTSVSAALICCLLGAMRPSKWHFAGWAAIAVLFFGFVYQDTLRANNMEREVELLVNKLSPGQRVMATILPPDDSRITIQHMIDRACIGHCFSYGNYEPSTNDFRVRANPGNPYVLSDYDDVVDMEEGHYEVQAGDLPVYQVYQCSPSGEHLCMHSLAEGEKNDVLGVHDEEDLDK